MDKLSRLSLDLFRDIRKKVKKTPYSELPKGTYVDISTDDDAEMDVQG